MGFPGGSDDKASACTAGRPRFNPWVWKIPWRRIWQPTSVSLPGKSHGHRSLVGYSPWGRKELGTTERLTLTSLLIQHQSLFLSVMLANSVLSLVSILSRVHPDLFKHKLLSQICIFFLVEQTSIFRSCRHCPPKETLRFPYKDGLADLSCLQAHGRL